MLTLRILMAVIMLPHAIGKITETQAFIDKFDVSLTLTALIALAEFSGALGVLAGYWHRLWWATWLGVAALAIVQIGAIALYHWPTWFYFKGGIEFNVVILVILAVILVGQVRGGELSQA